MKIPLKQLNWQRLEALAPLLLYLLFAFSYNEVGQLAGQRGSDYGPLLGSALDDWVPLVPIAILPYALYWFLPIIALAYLYAKVGWSPGPYRRLFVSLLLLMLGCMLLWVLFPVQVGLRATEEALAPHGVFGKWISQTYAAATPWNACPSFHVAGSWFLYRAVRFHVPNHSVFFPIATWLIIASTVLIRIHYVADIFFGLLVSEIAYRYLLRRLEENRSFDNVPAPRATGWSLGILGAGVAGYAILLGI